MSVIVWCRFWFTVGEFPLLIFVAIARLQIMLIFELVSVPILCP